MRLGREHGEVVLVRPARRTGIVDRAAHLVDARLTGGQRDVAFIRDVVLGAGDGVEVDVVVGVILLVPRRLGVGIHLNGRVADLAGQAEAGPQAPHEIALRARREEDVAVVFAFALEGAVENEISDFDSE